MALQILPDLTEDRWSYNGTAAIESGRHKGRSADSWIWKLKNKSDYGEYDNTYTFYVDKVRLRISPFHFLTAGKIPPQCLDQHR